MKPNGEIKKISSRMHDPSILFIEIKPSSPLVTIHQLRDTLYRKVMKLGKNKPNKYIVYVMLLTGYILPVKTWKLYHGTKDVKL